MSETLDGGSIEAHFRVTDNEFVKDFKDNNLTLAFLRQFPYGYGGVEEERIIAKYSETSK